MALDFAAVSIDLGGCTDKQEALERFQVALKFPDWFGGNWDALADCLADMSWWPAAGYLLLLEHAEGWREADPEEFDTALAIIDEAAQSWAAQHKPFWALLPAPP
jgi:RNAse (barnase) inhibitor barstar